MKKLFIIITTAAATAFSASTTVASTDHMFYLKGNIGANLMNKATDKDTGFKMKAKTAAIFAIGAGYYPLDNIRTDITFELISNPEMKKSGVDRWGNAGSAKHKGKIGALMLNGYIDLFDVGIAKVFAGAGVGVAQLKEKISWSAYSDTASSKKATNVAYQLTLGSSAEIAPGINIELTYSYKDFGKTKSVNKTSSGFTLPEFSKTAYKGNNLLAGIRFDL
jgi:opacity protein-like surface antigen